MSEIQAVVLMPRVVDKVRLLKKGPHGARPPMAYRFPDGRRWSSGWKSRKSGFFRALVLAWDGEPVPSGIDWLCRATGWEQPGDGIDIEELLQWWQDHRKSYVRSPGHLVALDADYKSILEG